jgi:hypothetical protein
MEPIHEKYKANKIQEHMSQNNITIRTPLMQ